MRFRAALLFTALTAMTLAPATAQRRQPTPEQRIDQLERQVRQVQKRVFPKGQPADTAGFVDDPAITQSTFGTVTSRLDAVERQMADILRQSEENGNRVATMEAELARLRAEQDQRLKALESGAGSANGGSTAEDGAPATDDTAEAPPPRPRPKVETGGGSAPVLPASTGNADVDAEAAYDAGYQLWNSGKYDAAIKSLQAFSKKYPSHRRVSWAKNLEGRALLDKGQPRAAAETLLANYRRDPKGERAQDSLFYLGQSLVRLGQPGQACKAYAELEDVYGSSLRPQLRSSLPNAKAEAKCS